MDPIQRSNEYEPNWRIDPVTATQKNEPGKEDRLIYNYFQIDLVNSRHHHSRSIRQNAEAEIRLFFFFLFPSLPMLNASLIAVELWVEDGFNLHFIFIPYKLKARAVTCTLWHAKQALLE